MAAGGSVVLWALCGERSLLQNVKDRVRSGTWGQNWALVRRNTWVMIPALLPRDLGPCLGLFPSVKYGS